MLDYLISAFRNLGRKKIRTFLTISGITIGVCSVIIIGAIGQGGELAVSKQLDNLGINGLNIQSKTSDTGVYDITLSDTDIKACMKVPGVKSVTPVVMQMGISVLRGEQKNAMIWGIDNNAEDIISISILHGKMFSKADVTSRAKVCLVDDSFAKSVYKRSNITGKKITLYMGKDAEEFLIKGVINSGTGLLNSLAGKYMPSFVYMPYTTAQDLKGIAGYDQISIKTFNESQIDSTGKMVVTALNNTHGVNDSFEWENMFKQKERLNNLLNIVTLIISAVGAISMVVAGLGIMTVMIVSVNERTKEIGIKKAIGAKKQVILFEFLFEALSICLVGGIMGILLGCAISYAASVIMDFEYSIRISSVILSSSLAIGIGVLFGVYPAMKAANLRPVDALRQE